MKAGFVNWAIREKLHPAWRLLRQAKCAANSAFRRPADEDECQHLLWLATSGVVASGPFAGLRTTGTSYGSCYLPKLLGTYEKELHPLWTPDWLGQFTAIINLGCAEGFYLAGIAHLLRSCGHKPPRLMGFDVDPTALAAAASFLRLNKCVDYSLAADGWSECLMQQTPPILLLCDIEGSEATMLDPANVPRLRTTHIVCEVHDEPGKDTVHRLLIDRFHNSHRIEQFLARPRVPSDYPQMMLGRFTDSINVALMNEHRLCGNRWLYFRPIEQQVAQPG